MNKENCCPANSKYDKEFPAIEDFVEEVSIKKDANSLKSATPKDFTYSVRIDCQPYDINDDPISLSDLESAVKFALSAWSTACQISFKKVPWNPSSPADINVAFKHHYLGGIGGAIGSWDGSTCAFYCFKSYDQYIPICWGENSILYIALHEVGHALGLPDHQKNNWGDYCIANYNPDPNYAPLPSPKCAYRTKTYYDWRMSDFGIVPDEQSLPPNYNIYEDLDVSIMDYDANGKAPWRPNRIGFWGRIDHPDIGQPQYISQYDIDAVVAKYGVPEQYYPIITVRLSTDWNGVDYTGGVGGGDAFVTTSWSEANKCVRGFQPPADVREIAGLSLKSWGQNRKIMYRFYNPATKDYRVSSSTYIPGWVMQQYLGYWLTNNQNVNVKIGTKTRSCSTIPMYQYYKPSINRYIVSPNNMVDGWDGWQKTLLGYIVDYNSITE